MSTEAYTRKPRPVVAIFRTDWLPASETFIRNQMAGMSRFNPVAVGLGRIESSLARDSDLLAMPEAPYDRLARRLFVTFRRNRRLVRILKSVRPDIVHAHFGTNAVVLLPIARRLRLPLVVTFHGVDATAIVNQPGFFGDLYRARLPKLFTYASRVIAASSSIEAHLLRLGAPAHKTVVHHIGVPLPKLIEVDCVDDSARRGVLFVGRLTEKKGVDDLLRAVAILNTRSITAPLTIIGDGPMRDELEALARELKVDAQFLGMAPPATVLKAMSAAEIQCVPSKTAQNGDSEATTMVIPEASALGTPIVGTRHGGIPEAVNEGVTGILVSEASSEDLADALASLLVDKPMARRMGEAGKKWVSEGFDINRQTEKLEKIYDSCIAEFAAADAAV